MRKNEIVTNKLETAWRTKAEVESDLAWRQICYSKAQADWKNASSLAILSQDHANKLWNIMIEERQRLEDATSSWELAAKKAENLSSSLRSGREGIVLERPRGGW
ncbi:MAG: hypothetical protein ACREBU_03205 [Nitrososphaera sp.]